MYGELSASPDHKSRKSLDALNLLNIPNVSILNSLIKISYFQ